VIDVKTGEVILQGVRVGSTTTISELLRSPLGKTLKKQSVGEPPWATYSAGIQDLAGKRFAILLCFHGEQLQTIDLSLSESDDETSWNAWSEASERAKKKRHDTLLRKVFGEPTHVSEVGSQFDRAWGEVISTYDPRSASSSIVVSYRRQKSKPKK
jgi:hypothetical protein